VLVRAVKCHIGHIIRLRDRAVCKLLFASHYVWYTTVDLVRLGSIGDTRIAYVPNETWQEGRCRKSISVVAREGLRHFQRNRDAASAHRGVEEAHRQVQGYDIIQSHHPRSNHRLGTSQLLVVFGHKRVNILRTVYIRDQQLQCVSETLKIIGVLQVSI